MTDPQSLDWGQLVETMRLDDGRDRARALWHACNEVLTNLQSYYPVGFGSLPPNLTKVSVSEILAHSARAAVESNHDAKAVVSAFATWRSHVTETEATNAARLFMLASTLQTLADLYARSTQPDVVSARIAHLGKFIEDVWAIAVPLTSRNLRGWSQWATRRYDLLSKEWREL